MAYDEALAERVRDLIGARDAVTERKMFGGIAWMLHGNMAVGIVGEDLLVRIEPDETERTLAEPGVRPFEMGRSPSKGFVLVAAEITADDAALAQWVDAGADRAMALPPK
jgi:TfoX/Sxy family transcriptional regulator of competence genes